MRSILFFLNLICQRRYPDNCPPRKIGSNKVLGLGQDWLSFRVGGQPDNCPRGKLPPVRVWVWVRVSFGVGGQFSPRPIVLKPSEADYVISSFDLKTELQKLISYVMTIP